MKNDPSVSACVAACRHCATSSGFSMARLCYRWNALMTAPGPRSRREPARQFGRDRRFPGSANRQHGGPPYGPMRCPVVGAGALGVPREEVPVQAEPRNMSRCGDLVNCHCNPSSTLVFNAISDLLCQLSYFNVWICPRHFFYICLKSTWDMNAKRI